VTGWVVFRSFLLLKKCLGIFYFNTRTNIRRTGRGNVSGCKKLRPEDDDAAVCGCLYDNIRSFVRIYYDRTNVLQHAIPRRRPPSTRGVDSSEPAPEPVKIDSSGSSKSTASTCPSSSSPPIPEDGSVERL
jgi:hypothetical protein